MGALKERFTSGGGLVTVPALWLRDVAQILNNLIVRNGTLVKSGNKWVIDCGLSANCSFLVSEGAPSGSSPTVNVAAGKCYYAGFPAQTIPQSALVAAASGTVYVTLQYSTGVFSGPSFSASAPASDDDTEIYEIADVTLSGSGGIATITQRHCGDIRETRA